MRIKSLLAIGTVCIPVSVFAAQNPFIENEGRLIIEAESVAASGQWSTESSIADHMGDGYHVWTGANHFGSPSNNTDNHITYPFHIDQAGNYQLRWRSRITVGDQATEHNDSWVQFPTGQNIVGEQPLNGWTKAYMGHIDTWTWDAYTVDGVAATIRQYFEAGDHVMLVSGRSNGHAIDRIALFQYESTNFSAAEYDSLAESPRLNDGMATHEQLAHSCYANTFSLPSEIETSLSDTDTLLTSQLTISNNGRYGYVQFDMSQAPENITSASLELIQQVESSPATIAIYASNDSNWNSSTAAADLPYPSVIIGQANLSGKVDEVQAIDIDVSQLTSTQQTLILAIENNTDEMLLGAGNQSTGPRLRLAGGPDFCQNFVDTDDESNPSQPEPEPEPQPEPEPEDNTDESPIDIFPIDPSEDEEPMSSTKSSRSGPFGGSISLLALLALSLLKSAAQRKAARSIDEQKDNNHP
ncbi:MAG: hypothetical protein KTR32_16975 [Granulosicoccus sp.]|nr:hypothetical protein [Granulosicoccus sp.]